MPPDKTSVLMLTWEFPPRVIGGISSHVNDLSQKLTLKGVEVHVVTCDFPGAPEYEEKNGVHVYRFNSYKIPSYSFLGWVFSMNENMAEKAIDVVNANDENVDIIHAHDWLVANAAFRLKSLYRKPLVSTIHATEAGRRGGIHNDYQRAIYEVEKRLTQESSKVICCSHYMADQISDNFGIAKEKLHVIPNGVNAAKFNYGIDTRSVRRKYAEHGEKIVTFVGRLVHEKGVHVLVGAVPKILGILPDVNFVIVGEGGMKEYLLKEAWDFGVAHRIFFTGFLDEKNLVAIYKASSAAVFPSLYEPFGITVLEAMAAKTPVIVSDTGGLSETVEHDKTGVKVYVDNSDSLAWGTLRVLQDNAYADRLRQNAYRKVIRCYSWETIADKTTEVYRQALLTSSKEFIARSDIRVPVFRFDGYSGEFRVLLFLHVLGAVEAGRARSTAELSLVMGVRIEELRRLLSGLVDSDYVAVSRDSARRLRYYLTGKGIVKACSLFS